MKPTQIIISENFSGFHERGFEGDKDQTTNCLVRDIFLKRNGAKHSINHFNNLSNTDPREIVNEKGEVIFRLTKQDIEEQNNIFQTYLGLRMVFLYMHTDEYKEIDCCGFFELINGIEYSYSEGGVIDKNKYLIKIIPPDLLEEGTISFETGDVLMSTETSNPNDIDLSTLEVTNEDFSYTGPHFFVYLGNDYFISKYGYYHKFSIGKINEIMGHYGTRNLFYLEPKEGVKSKYLN